MRHGKKINHLSRKTAHRSAMLSNMACSLIEHKRINTTLAKAKALRKYVEPLITKSKEDSTHNRRVVFRYLRDKDASFQFSNLGKELKFDDQGRYQKWGNLNLPILSLSQLIVSKALDLLDHWTT